MALGCKIRSSKLKKYEKEFLTIRENEMQQEDPVTRLEVGTWYFVTDWLIVLLVYWLIDRLILEGWKKCTVTLN